MKHNKEERTLIIIKPDGVQRSLVGEVVSRFERVGLKLVGMKMIVANPEHIEQHYTLDPTWRVNSGTKAIESYKKKGETPPSNDPMEVSAKVLENLKKYMTSGPIVVMAWQGAHAVGIVRKLTGGTEPLSSDVGTIRGDFVLDSYQMADTDGRAVRNIIHASGSPEEANMELNHWFDRKELLDYTVVQERILYDVNLDGILE